jgi:hypothetical protein
VAGQTGQWAPVRPEVSGGFDRVAQLSDRHTPVLSQFRVVFVEFLDCFMFMTSRWFLFVCDTIVCWCKLSWCELVLGYELSLLFMCRCWLRPWEYSRWWIGARLWDKFRSRRSRISYGMLRLENSACGGEGFHMAYTWCCVRMKKRVKFWLESKFGRIGAWGCTGMLFPWFGRFPMWLGVLVLVGFVARGSHVLGINKRGVETRSISTFWERKVTVCFEASILVCEVGEGCFRYTL